MYKFIYCSANKQERLSLSLCFLFKPGWFINVVLVLILMPRRQGESEKLFYQFIILGDIKKFFCYF